MTGLEILVAIVGAFGAAVGGLFATAIVSERRKRRFVGALASALEAGVDDVESGDIARPLAFRLGGVRVCALLRGHVEVWQLERSDPVTFDAEPIAVVYSGWRAPDARDLSPVGVLTSRLSLYSRDDDGRARGLLARARADLALILGARTRRCIVGRGKALLEVTRRGLAVDELADALLRFDALLAVFAGQTPVLPLPAAAGESAVAGPVGVPVPALTG